MTPVSAPEATADIASGVFTGTVGPHQASPDTGTDPDRGRHLHRALWPVVLLVGLSLFELLRLTLIGTRNPNLLPAMVIVGAGVVPASFVSFILSRRLPFDVPGGVLAAVAVVGGVIGIIVAGTLEYDVLRRLPTASVAAVAAIEEAAKLLVPLIILLVLRRYRAPLDGLLIGVATGAGFAGLETTGYAFVALVNTHGSLSAVDDVLAVRGVLSPAGHMAWTGLTASALWLAAHRGWSRPATLQAIATYLAALGLHAAWDGIGTAAAYVIIAVIGLGALTAYAGLLHQNRTLRIGRALTEADDAPLTEPGHARPHGKS